MGSNTASNDAPMTLGKRLVLEQTRVQFQVASHEMIFSTTILDLLTKERLCVFVDSVLSRVNREHPTHDTPSPGAWKLMRNNMEEDLNKWNPHILERDVPMIIVSNIDMSLKPITTTPSTRNTSSWAWAKEVRSFGLPAGVAFELQGGSHLLLVLRCQTKVKISNKQKRVEETIHNILVPANYGISDVIKLIRACSVNGVYDESNQHDLKMDKRSARELGWKHGTTLRLELW